MNLIIQLRRGASGLGVELDAKNKVVGLITGGQAEADGLVKINDAVVAVDGVVLGAKRLPEVLAPGRPLYELRVRRDDPLVEAQLAAAVAAHGGDAAAPRRLLEVRVRRGRDGLGLTMGAASLVQRVAPGSPAAEDGALRQGDLVVAVDRKWLGTDPLPTLLRKEAATFTFTILRSDDKAVAAPAPPPAAAPAPAAPSAEDAAKRAAAKEAQEAAFQREKARREAEARGEPPPPHEPSFEMVMRQATAAKELTREADTNLRTSRDPPPFPPTAAEIAADAAAAVAREAVLRGRRTDELPPPTLATEPMPMEVGRKPPAELQRFHTAREIADDDDDDESEEEEEESALRMRARPSGLPPPSKIPASKLPPSTLLDQSVKAVAAALANVRRNRANLEPQGSYALEEAVVAAKAAVERAAAIAAGRPPPPPAEAAKEVAAAKAAAAKEAKEAAAAAERREAEETARLEAEIASRRAAVETVKEAEAAKAAAEAAKAAAAKEAEVLGKALADLEVRRRSVTAELETLEAEAAARRSANFLGVGSAAAAPPSSPPSSRLDDKMRAMTEAMVTPATPPKPPTAAPSGDEEAALEAARAAVAAMGSMLASGAALKNLQRGAENARDELPDEVVAAAAEQAADDEDDDDAPPPPPPAMTTRRSSPPMSTVNEGDEDDDDDDDDDEAPPPPPPNPPPKVKVVRSAPKKGVTVVRSAPKTEPAARSLRVDEKQAIGDDDETAAALRTMLKQARKLGDDALVTSLQQQLFEMGAETRRIELES